MMKVASDMNTSVAPQDATMPRPLDLLSMVSRLDAFWRNQGCLILPPYDMEMGAATFHPATFLKSLDDKPWRAAFMQPCRRPSDGRYGDNPNRLQHYFQYQVLLKPAPANIVDLYWLSLKSLGIDLTAHDFRLVEDDWESPSLGAWGLGWEVWGDGMEITQFTYFQQVGGLDVSLVTGEITYGLERLAMFVQNKSNVYDLDFGPGPGVDAPPVTYGDMYHIGETAMCHENFGTQPSGIDLDDGYPLADNEHLKVCFDHEESQFARLINRNLVVPAYNHCIKASHILNLLEARGCLSVAQRQSMILRIRAMSANVAKAYVAAQPSLTL